ncbi:hypothetical protein EHI8A_053610 [Entamoeba histolytica HM-1:IMSS-B]|uniref:Uncharacterized protein n=8 Tax=Entamoeba TaxID=5758 RepID=C4MA10_ENTH1|nr:hypothetical protein ENU1_168070 [Entamoeba nuttalli P19]XP_649036.1 hypothetical protein EHI_146540 [Entamoeba histolytica HM-1:IMSS]EMD48801.1 Hypothetical protein EHI5A_071230 [Entamoeba histolytica KU27]EMH76186.1 hypothetical protein EHI8A_053610 [Entamoeba histolytica HM-1:IMSS-B]EMS17843.1 hypothetical protein KM1_103560 [Entamoeba histolytica HM-3:IMSS]ENY61425.1 hypothetical protein EHI7A_180630 [Entamoeba histolytica HM-1:IMSS-A]GAT98579.1 hypothetical protein CL6EHI_146540 [Enta|eukprot:XP_008859289.1 hypothetical protein ENU1_168070 [Entamoeba nuttalli P19]
MKQATIEERLINTTSDTIEKTTKRICDITAVVADEQTKLWQIVDKANRVQIQQNYYLKSVIDDENQSVIDCQHKMEDIITDMAKYRTITSFTTMTYTLNDLFDFIKSNYKR